MSPLSIKARMRVELTGAFSKVLKLCTTHSILLSFAQLVISFVEPVPWDPK